MTFVICALFTRWTSPLRLSSMSLARGRTRTRLVDTSHGRSESGSVYRARARSISHYLLLGILRVLHCFRRRITPKPCHSGIIAPKMDLEDTSAAGRGPAAPSAAAGEELTALAIAYCWMSQHCIVALGGLWTSPPSSAGYWKLCVDDMATVQVISFDVGGPHAAADVFSCVLLEFDEGAACHLSSSSRA